MITAENYILNNAEIGRPPTPDEVASWMIEFAKIHVKEALREAEQKVYEDDGESVTSNIILTAYPLENIK